LSKEKNPFNPLIRGKNSKFQTTNNKQIFILSLSKEKNPFNPLIRGKNSKFQTTNNKQQTNLHPKLVEGKKSL
jgi:hypothetical protein